MTGGEEVVWRMGERSHEVYLGLGRSGYFGRIGVSMSRISMSEFPRKPPRDLLGFSTGFSERF